MGILLRELVRECVHDVLHCIISESHAVRMWHYTGFSDGLSIISSNEFRKIMSIGMELLSGKYSQFILRACSDNGFPENKLVEIYKSYGFVPYQETDDGTIMYFIK